MQTSTYTSYGLNLPETKNYLKVEHTIDDDLINVLITGSYIHVRNFTNRDFLPTTSSLNLYDQEVAYLSGQRPDWIGTGSLLQANNRYYVRFDAPYSGPVLYGTGAVNAYPTDLKIAQMMLVASAYEIRGNDVIGVSISRPSTAAETLMTPYRDFL